MLFAQTVTEPEKRALKSNEAANKKLKELAAGPLGKELSKIPLLYANAAFFGQKPSPKRPTKIFNGTIALIDLGKGPMGITCHHVIQGYREYRKKYEDVLFNIGTVELDPIDQLIDENDKIDLALIQLTSSQVKEITSVGEIGSQVHKPRNWPPAPPEENEFVLFGGFPGCLKTVESKNEFIFSSWSCGGSRIDSVSEYRFISPFEREYWIRSFGKDCLMSLEVLGGMSGGPAFISRGLYFEFVGVLTDYGNNYDAVFFASVQSVNQDGTITPPPG